MPPAFSHIVRMNPSASLNAETVWRVTWCFNNIIYLYRCLILICWYLHLVNTAIKYQCILINYNRIRFCGDLQDFRMRLKCISIGLSGLNIIWQKQNRFIWYLHHNFFVLFIFFIWLYNKHKCLSETYLYKTSWKQLGQHRKVYFESNVCFRTSRWWKAILKREIWPV